LRDNAKSAIGEARQLIQEQADYAKATGHTYFAVRSLCNLAASILKFDPQTALEWSAMAREFDPWDPVGWNTAVSALQALHRSRDAVSLGFAAVTRFPQNAFARNGLADVLKQAGRLKEAEALYRETVELFPQNVVARVGLADVLKQAGQLQQAEALYRETMELSPQDVFARSGLADVLKQARSKVLHQETPEQKSEDLPPPAPPKEVPQHQRTSEPAGEETLPKIASVTAEAVTGGQPIPEQVTQKEEVSEHIAEKAISAAPPAGISRQDADLLVHDSYLLRQWSRVLGTGRSKSLEARVHRLLNKLSGAEARFADAASEMGLLRLEMNEMEEALVLLREAAKRFPGSARVQYTLARVEREAAERSELRADAPGSAGVLNPWRVLVHIDERLGPLSYLGTGRAWLAMRDGHKIELAARQNLGQLGFWITKTRERYAERAKHGDTPDLTIWWADEVQCCVFGEGRVSGFEDISELAYVGWHQHLQPHQIYG